MVLEQPKKPVGGAFGVFLAEKRQEYSKKFAGQHASTMSGHASDCWKKLTADEKTPYEKLFFIAKDKYEKDLAAFLAAGGEKKKGVAALRTEKRKALEDPKAQKATAKRTKLNDDPNRPKKPAAGAYGCFLDKHRKSFQKACPGSIAAVAKLAGDTWKALAANEKKVYEDEYALKKDAYEKAMKVYTAAEQANKADEVKTA